jgi:ribulose-phosphate 3-epimerase
MEGDAGARVVRLGAALFNADHGRLAEEVARLQEAGLDFVHLDVFDGYFVPDVGFPPRSIAALRPLTRLPFEVHLGVAEPLRFLPALADSGVDLILFHIESALMPFETLFSIRSRGLRAGVALSLGTPLSTLEPLAGSMDACLLLSRVTGEGTRGASFNRAVLPRVRAAREILSSREAACDLQAAGGINRTNAASLVAAGAGSLTLGAGIYGVPDMAREVAEVRAMARDADVT